MRHMVTSPAAPGWWSCRTAQTLGLWYPLSIHTLATSPLTALDSSQSSVNVSQALLMPLITTWRTEEGRLRHRLLSTGCAALLLQAPTTRHYY